MNSKQWVSPQKKEKKRSGLGGNWTRPPKHQKFHLMKNNFRNNWATELVFSGLVQLTSRTFPLNMSLIAQIFRKLFLEECLGRGSLMLTDSDLGDIGNFKKENLSKFLSEFSDILHTRYLHIRQCKKKVSHVYVVSMWSIGECNWEYMKFMTKQTFSMLS